MNSINSENNDNGANSQDELIRRLRTENERLEALLKKQSFEAAKKGLQTHTSGSYSRRGETYARDRAIQMVGGNALWHQLPLARRLELLGFATVPTSSDEKEAKRLFGNGSDSNEQQQLHRSDYERYRFLRAIAVEFDFFRKK